MPEFVNYFLQTNLQKKSLFEFYFVDNSFLRFAVKSTTLPFTKLMQETKDTGERYYTGTELGGDFSIEIYENETFDNFDYFKKWFDSVYDNVRKVFELNPIIKTGVIMFKKGDRTPNYLFQLNEMKISGIDPISLSYDVDEPLTFTINVSTAEVLPIRLV